MEFTKQSASASYLSFTDSSVAFGSPARSYPGYRAASSPLEAELYSSNSSEATRLVFVDPRVSNYQSLVSDLEPGTEVYVLNPLQDAIQQITQTLLKHHGVSSLYVVSHGTSGSLEVGANGLNLDNLSSYGNQLKSWSTALTANADILLYGCNVAQGETGLSFVQQLAQLTGADVAASNDLTGSTALGGNWDLEVKTGTIESSLVFSKAEWGYSGLLAQPVLTLPTGAITYTENAPPVIVNSTATVTDADNPAFFNGSLDIVLNGGTDSDRIGIRNEGNGPGQIGLDGRIVTYGGTEIGVTQGGIGTDPFVVFLTGPATPAAVEALLRNITYSNVAENLPAARNLSLSISLNDGIEVSDSVSRDVILSGVNDAPSIGIASTLYDGTTNLLPTTAGSAPGGSWFAYRDTSLLGGTATQTPGGGGTTFNTDLQIYAGYSNYQFTQTGFPNVTFTPSLVNPGFPVLDRTTGYDLSFNLQVLSEAHNAAANKNNDGKDDRAGFSVILIGNDLKGIELGFWQDRIWAQEDGTSQLNPSLEPDTPPQDDFRTLFTQAEFVNFDTTAQTSYDLAVFGNSYTLFGNGTALLSGKLRDYTAWVPPTVTVPPFIQVTLPDTYSLPNFIFLGDGTPTAGASVKINSVSVATNTPLPARSVTENSPLVLSGEFIGDLDAETNNVTVTLSAANGTVLVNSGVPGGLTNANITNNGSSLVTLTGTLSQINTTLANATALTYQGNPSFFGTDTLTITANDGGATGGAAQTTSRSITITVNPLNPPPPPPPPVPVPPIANIPVNPVVPVNSSPAVGVPAPIISTAVFRLKGSQLVLHGVGGAKTRVRQIAPKVRIRAGRKSLRL